MSGVQESEGLSVTVELKGHLIDSLTLSKVIDLVQHLEGDYHLNDIRVGSHKKDISSINMTLYAPNEATMEQILEVIAHYGVAPTDEHPGVKTAVCERAGVLPDEAFGVKLPRLVFHQGEWKELENGGLWTVVLENGATGVRRVTELQPGDVLISGTQGLQW